MMPLYGPQSSQKRIYNAKPNGIGATSTSCSNTLIKDIKTLIEKGVTPELEKKLNDPKFKKELTSYILRNASDTSDASLAVANLINSKSGIITAFLGSVSAQEIAIAIKDNPFIDDSAKQTLSSHIKAEKSSESLSNRSYAQKSHIGFKETIKTLDKNNLEYVGASEPTKRH